MQKLVQPPRKSRASTKQKSIQNQAIQLAVLDRYARKNFEMARLGGYFLGLFVVIQVLRGLIPSAYLFFPCLAAVIVLFVIAVVVNRYIALSMITSIFGPMIITLALEVGLFAIMFGVPSVYYIMDNDPVWSKVFFLSALAIGGGVFALLYVLTSKYLAKWADAKFLAAIERSVRRSFARGKA